MMVDRTRNVLIGLFTLGGIICFAALAIAFSESRGLFQREHVVEAKFSVDHMPSVLRVGTEVDLAGLWVGSVGEIRLVDPQDPSQGIIAKLKISDRYRVPMGSEAQVVVPLMGQPVVNIVPPSTPSVSKEEPTLIPGRVVNPLESVIDPKLMATLEKTTAQIGELAGALTPAANAVTGLLEKRPIDQVESSEARIKGITANLSTTIERFYSVLTNVDKVLGDPQSQKNVKVMIENFLAASEDAKSAVADLRAFSQQAKEVADSAKNTMSKVDEMVGVTRTHIDALGTRLTAATDKLSRVLDSLVVASDLLVNGKGAAAMLLRDPKLYDELLLTLQRAGGWFNEMKVLVKQWQDQGLKLKTF